MTIDLYKYDENNDEIALLKAEADKAEAALNEAQKRLREKRFDMQD